MEKELKYFIEPSRLTGEVKLSGAKNSALKLLAASLLTSEPVTLTNYPDSLLDTRLQMEMLEALGKKCEISPGQAVIREPSGIAIKSVLEWDKRSVRSTLLLLGALTARTGHGAVPLPGGCPLGERKYDLHVMLLEKLGARVWQENDLLCAEAPSGLRGTEIHLPLRSTGATENAIICGCLAAGVTRVWNPHIRPEILDLIAFIRTMGAEINVYGQQYIEIHGVSVLNGAKHRIIPDNMEALTWLIGAVITGGDVEIQDFPYEHLEVPLIHLRESGAKFYRGSEAMIVRGGTPYPIEISTGPYPGINSDMQPLFAVYGACASGESRIVDLRFFNRYGYAEELAKIGVETKIVENTLMIAGGKKLHAAEVTACDLRAGVALVLAGLTAPGCTVLRQAWQVERGYDLFVKKLRGLNGKITAVEEGY